MLFFFFFFTFFAYVIQPVIFKPINSHSDLIFFLSMHDLHSLSLVTNKLSIWSDNLPCINLLLSINFILYRAVSPLSCSFLSGTEKVMYFSVFSPKQLNRPLNSSGNCLIMKCQSHVEPL